MVDSLHGACERYIEWVENRLVRTARGDDLEESEFAPSGRFWLGRLTPEEVVLQSDLGERGERLSPCAMGFRLKLKRNTAVQIRARIRASYWTRQSNREPWTKTRLPDVDIEQNFSAVPGTMRLGGDTASQVYAAATGNQKLRAELDVEIKPGTKPAYVELAIVVVNSSKKGTKSSEDNNLYEVSMELADVESEPFMLEALPDSFRYDRRIIAYGINCGVAIGDDRSLRTVDVVSANQYRPSYWSRQSPAPNLSFSSLSKDPVSAARELRSALATWGEDNWNGEVMAQRARDESWTAKILEEAKQGQLEFREELNRLAEGIALLASEEDVRNAFCMMNEAMTLMAGKHGYDAWRPFQYGFLIANLGALTQRQDETGIADVVWFATGGGKTETYLAMIMAAAFLDRLTGKSHGITAWSRFPLRMLSLQQTQRFADAMAAAEIVRRSHELKGAPFSVGFFVGMGATPNSIPEDPAKGGIDVEDDEMPNRYRVLRNCPFCGNDRIQMRFNRRLWTLEHICEDPDCPWPADALPFYVVDEEIYRYLPTVLVGTLDKAASISMQAGMRGLVGAPYGVCSEESHGFVYASRSGRPSGCFVPGCGGKRSPLPMDEKLFPPSMRLQDELHLLKDSLGAVDSHYEALYDGLQLELCGRRPKVLASSATLSGYDKQVDVLYRRTARVFPSPPPYADSGFWTATSGRLMRRYVALAPRGVTLEYMIDRVVTTLQESVRYLLGNQEDAAKQIGVPVEAIPQLVSIYGTNVIYGNTLRDLDAVDRSLETQINLPPGHRLNKDTLTSRQDFENVRIVLDRLEHPESDFQQRIHVITASSMMSHGVDIDRLNSMCMVGMPLTTSEFIQATARIGRRWPGLVLVAMKMGRERDAAIHRLFEKYVQQGDRFVEPIPITKRSRRVLQRTAAGMELARLLAVHEPASGEALTTVRTLRKYFEGGGFTESDEFQALARYLQLGGQLDDGLRSDLEEWVHEFIRNLENPDPEARFPSDLSPTGGAMRSLRDVEEQAPIYGSLSS